MCLYVRNKKVFLDDITVKRMKKVPDEISYETFERLFLGTSVVWLRGKFVICTEMKVVSEIGTEGKLVRQISGNCASTR